MHTKDFKKQQGHIQQLHDNLCSNSFTNL